MSPLSAVLAMLAALVAAGSTLVAAFSLDLYGWLAILVALGTGAFGGAALAQPLEAEIKRLDPAWDDLRTRAPIRRLRAEDQPGCLGARGGAESGTRP